jgi:elongation factor P
MQYLYKSGEMYSFMNKETYETLDVAADIIGDDAQYLKEGLDVIAALHEGVVVAIELPKKIQYTVVESPPAVKGDTASGNVTKEITLDNGLKIQAPIFIKENEEVLVNTETGDYAGRVNE